MWETTFVNWFAAKWALFRGSTITNLPDKAPPQTTDQGASINGATPPPHTDAIANEKGKADLNSETKPGMGMVAATDYDLPTRWTHQPIGGLSYSHAEYHTNNQQIRFDLSVVGGGFRTNGDDFFFVYKTNESKEFTFTATLVKIDPPSQSSICGIMIRESKTVNSSFLFIGASSEHFLVYLRETNGVLPGDSQDLR